MKPIKNPNEFQTLEKTETKSSIMLYHPIPIPAKKRKAPGKTWVKHSDNSKQAINQNFWGFSKNTVPATRFRPPKMTFSEWNKTCSHG